jgi:hypothetical protein
MPQFLNLGFLATWAILSVFTFVTSPRVNQVRAASWMQNTF